ncbi:putative protein disulfide-isomerase A6 [Zancudomyces culisetae]|uniref:Thioredoxin domain-containing protein n=1 Tax=Zancudomyces culisetae TaxID=1213189 RepID=A0A1R1PTT3_ZANCU|nr:putative protein disulfide-isomerase A6 [Zancudomyces culisetae]|eukprot:OMH84406.1 putative protein disulfide-isomerase A6 [Zancudomyces culisetae]
MRLFAKIIIVTTSVYTTLGGKPSNVEQLTKANFSERIKWATGGAVVEYRTPWCGGCQMMEKSFNDLANRLSSTAKRIMFATVNCDEEAAICSRFVTVGYPTIVVYHNGSESNFKRFVGYLDKKELDEEVGKELERKKV